MDATTINLIIALCMVIIGGFVGLKWVKYRALDANYVKQKVKVYEDLAEEYKQEMYHWKGKFMQSKQVPQIDGSIDELESILPNLFTEFSPYVPTWLKPLLNNKDVQTWMIKYVHDNPDKAGEWFGKIIRKSNVNKESSNQNTQIL
jgi:hypothetical protein